MKSQTSNLFGRPGLRIIGSRQSSLNQGHDLLSHHLGRSSWKVSGWRGVFWQRAVAALLRRFTRYRSHRPALAYNLFLANWFSRSGFVHLLWGDHVVELLERPGRCILTLHQPFEFWTEREWRLLGRCAGVVCMAERECSEILRRHPDLACVFIPHGVDTAFWRDQLLSPKLQICAVGRHLRNFEMLLRVARILLERHPQLNFYWVVNPDFKLSPALGDLLPPERFQIVRDLSAEDLRRLYAESWLFCTPYNNVAASNSIVEAMATGTPIFTTRVGGMPSYGPPETITMVANNDDAALVEAVSDCLASPGWRAQLAVRGREYALKHFSWPVVVSAHESFYRRVAQARSQRGTGRLESPAAPLLVASEQNPG